MVYDLPVPGALFYFKATGFLYNFQVLSVFLRQLDLFKTFWSLGVVSTATGFCSQPCGPWGVFEAIGFVCNLLVLGVVFRQLYVCS